MTPGHNFRNVFLFASLLLSLALSASADLHWRAPGSDLKGHCEGSSLSSAFPSSGTQALTTPPGSRGNSQASKHNRTKHPIPLAGVVSGKFSTASGATNQFALGCDAPLVDSSFCFSRPKGRAPPQST